MLKQQTITPNLQVISETYTPLILDCLTLKDLFNTGIISKSILVKFILLLDYGDGLEKLIDKNNNIVWGEKHRKDLLKRWFQYSDPEVGIKKIDITDTEISKTLSELIDKLALNVNSIQLIIAPEAYSKQLKLNLEENENQD